jgi:hypothetical protein
MMKKYPEPDNKRPETLVGKGPHTYQLWKENAYAERASIVARANELMILISETHRT